MTEPFKAQDYEVRKGGDGKWGIYTRGYNVRVAVFAPNSYYLRENLGKIFDDAFARSKAKSNIKGHVWRQEADQNHYAERDDGVVAKFTFGHVEKPYAVHRGAGKTFEWLKGRDRVRTFKTLEAAMAAADKDWP